MLGCIMNPLTLGKPLSKCLPIIVISKYPHNPDRFVNAENVEKSFSHWQPCSALGVNQILNRSPESGLSMKVTHQIRTLGLDEDYCHLPIPPKLILSGELRQACFPDCTTEEWSFHGTEFELEEEWPPLIRHDFIVCFFLNERCSSWNT